VDRASDFLPEEDSQFDAEEKVMSDSFTGGCQCGAERYEFSGEPLFCGNCHCRDCQRASDGAYFPALGVPADALKITGEPKYYESAADSGSVAIRGFCPNCGARLFAKSSVNPTVIEIYAGSLDDPSIPNPRLGKPSSNRVESASNCRVHSEPNSYSLNFQVSCSARADKGGC
jgi:hypothetical protein